MNRRIYRRFIEDAIIINPQRIPLLKQHPFFCCFDEYSNLTVLSFTALKGHDIVYLAPQNGNKLDEIKRYQTTSFCAKSQNLGGQLMPERAYVYIMQAVL